MEKTRDFAVVLLICAFACAFCFAGGVQGGSEKDPNSSSARFEELLELVQHGNAYQRRTAIWPMAKTGDPRAVGVIMDLLKDPNDSVREHAALSLKHLEDKRSADALANALGDSSCQVRRYAASILAKVGEERHVPALVAAVAGGLSNLDRLGDCDT